MLYGHKVFVSTTYGQVVHMLYEFFFPIQVYGNFAFMLYGHKVFVHTTYVQVVYILYGKIFFFLTTYRNFYHNGQLHYRCAFVRTD